jgi:RES domain-containing protein
VLSAWRITKTRYASSAFDGEGARINGGRWNSPGTRVVYASESVALATLEILVGLQDAALLSAYSLIRVDFPSKLVEVLERKALPSSWKQQPPSAETRSLGDLWVAEARSAVLRVPSAIVEEEHNYLFNPRHPDFRRVRIGRPQRFRLDPRLSAPFGTSASRSAKPPIQ